MYNDGIREEASERDVNKRIAEIFFRNEKAVREKNKISQKTMGELLNCTGMAISNWELGKYVPENLDEIVKNVAELFDLDPGVLVNEDFADRYDPSIYTKVEAPEETESPKEDLTPVYEINGRYYTNQRETDREIAIRYLMREYKAATEKYLELEEQISKLSTEMNIYEKALEALGIEIAEKEEEVL